MNSLPLHVATQAPPAEASSSLLDGDLMTIGITSAVIVGVALLVHVILHLLLRRAGRMHKGRLRWGGIAASALRKPVGVGIWLVAALLLVDEGLRAATHFWVDDEAFVEVASSLHLDVLPAARSVVIVLMTTLFVVGFLRGVQHELEQSLAQQHGDVTAVQGLGSIVVVMVWVLGVLTALDAVGVNTTAILAVLGLSSAGLAFAAKDLLGNFFGGIMLLFNRPFEVGDWVQVGSVDGGIERIGLYATQLRALDKRLIWIPNQTFTSSIVHNPSRRTHRRLDETIGLRYEDLPKAPAIMKDLQALLDRTDSLDGDQMRLVCFGAYGDSTVDIRLVAHSTRTGLGDFNKLREAIMLEAAEIVAAHEADFAFPTVTLDGLPAAT
ncbi:MAG: mechanosensitive ion channel family protein [Phycisphaerales bacterium]|nr:mechanosensitive ion channel family protein [Phycisphaerales bacterium]